MATVSEKRARPTPENDPWFYGWRYVPRTDGPDGLEKLVQVPLTERDVLFPQEEDFIVQTTAHERDIGYLKTVFDHRLQDDPGAVVLCDCRTDFNVEGLEPLGPDIVVGQECSRKYDDWSTFHVGEEGVRIVLVVEVTSPSTRKNDVGEKRDFYHQAGVEYYVIADAGDEEAGRHLHLTGLHHTPSGWEAMTPNERGWLWLPPLDLWLGIVPADERIPYERLACYDAEGRELGDYNQVVQELEAAAQARSAAEARALEERVRADAERARADAERARADAAHARADAAHARADREALLRAEADERLRVMEAELRRLRGDS